MNGCSLLKAHSVVPYIFGITFAFMTGGVKDVFLNESVIEEDRIMGRYMIAWLLGVPLSILALIYVLTHMF